jgi:hypothetical protein
MAVLPGVRRPIAVGFKFDEIRRLITIGETSINSKIAQAV